MTSPVTYTAFGERRSGVIASPFGFTGGLNALTDADSGLVLMGYRYYQPDTGRFLSPDPARSGDNWYDYCENDPVNSVDPLGLNTQPVKKGSPQGNKVQAVINKLRELGRTQAADKLQEMLDNGSIWTDSDQSDPAITRYHYIGGANIYLRPALVHEDMFWDLLLGLYHEFIHVSQGWWQYWYGSVHQSEISAWRAELELLWRVVGMLRRNGGLGIRMRILIEGKISEAEYQVKYYEYLEELRRWEGAIIDYFAGPKPKKRPIQPALIPVRIPAR